jgi:hypothetical protein
MSLNHRDGEEHSDQEERIDELKRQAEQAAKGKIIAWDSDVLSPEQREQFWRRVVEYELAPSTSDFQQLTEAGLDLPEPDAMDNEQLASKLWELIGTLARMRVFIQETNHLSDRELYTLLWRDVLRQETPILPGEHGSVRLRIAYSDAEQTIGVGLGCAARWTRSGAGAPNARL